MNRKKSREIAMELLFGMTLSKNTLEETIEHFIEEYEMKLKTIDVEYIKNILEVVEKNKEIIDEKITVALVNWKLDRISKVNLTILRLAVAEMLYLEDVPEKVAINEALELTKIYSDEKSVAFINGVLDNTFKKM
ncbi:transcription antitermination factor NusB [Clostridium gasigenes]|uniref:Transcription antitermination protein NusB n=2 Tax=Clostridium TaxID=1485 RepID=A0A1H0MZ07_9CLOT|nr:transcription antitermination factor NusB [Clostridium gasigenes]MBB6625183.1 transcription antitermination factor NusB [Clostridium gasigenes]MBB6716187.1 transcription antitermination factor NusB [Clostridium gasigenes]MBU3087375.1 transcription antitermination factor NusB [Clostridium gasigenes]MBU3102904.1 transcription antitermination factor NusB [Clostridium gasigenes]MBU3106614.1 transcription antitermination factor NusB [Clostridium gasigenes]